MIVLVNFLGYFSILDEFKKNTVHFLFFFSLHNDDITHNQWNACTVGSLYHVQDMCSVSYASQHLKRNIGKFKTKFLFSIQSLLTRNTFVDMTNMINLEKINNKKVHTKMCLICYELAFLGPHYVNISLQNKLFINISSLKSYSKDFLHVIDRRHYDDLC